MTLFFLSTELIQGQENPSRYLLSMQRKYSGLKDYTADIRIHFDMEALKAPDMQAKLYYKSPDKMKETYVTERSRRQKQGITLLC